VEFNKDNPAVLDILLTECLDLNDLFELFFDVLSFSNDSTVEFVNDNSFVCEVELMECLEEYELSD